MCAGEMILTRCEDQSDGLKWECRQQVNCNRHKAEVSIRKGRWFEKSKMTLEEILKLTYWWCQDLYQAQNMKEDLLKALGWTGAASVAKFAESLYWKTVTN